MAKPKATKLSEQGRRVREMLRDMHYRCVWEIDGAKALDPRSEWVLECWIGPRGVLMVQSWAEAGVSIYSEGACPVAFDDLPAWLSSDGKAERPAADPVLQRALDGLLAAFPHAPRISDILQPIINEVRAAIDGKAAPVEESASLGVCPECGSAHVYSAKWVGVNSGDIGEDTAIDGFHCAACDERFDELTIVPALAAK